MRFYSRIIVLYQTNALVSHSIPQNYFRWNFSKRGSRGEHRQSSYWANKQQWTARIRNNQGNQHIKNKFSHFKSILQKSETTNRPSQPINAPIKLSSNPSSPHPEERIWAEQTPPAAALGPGRSEGQARQDETILHDWHGAKKMVILSCQKMQIPLAREGKISLAMRNQAIQRAKIDFAEGWQTRGT